MKQNLVCYTCNKEYATQMLYSCPSCGGILDVFRKGKPEDKKIILEGSSIFRSGLWKYFEMLPVQLPENVISIGEGETPLITDYRIADAWGLDVSLHIKAESLNPTGSFKDRPSSVGMSVAKEMGLGTVIVASSGNAAASVAAYAARGGMRCVVVVPETTDLGKLTQTYAYGAEVIGVKGNYSDCFAFVKKMSKHFGWANLVSTYINPYTVVGNKTISYELLHQLGYSVPDYITVPIGTGPLLAGVLQGYREMLELGIINKLPKMVGVQVTECEPIATAYHGGHSVRAWEKPINSIAGGISDPLVGYEKDGEKTINLIRSSEGTMVSLSEEEVASATQVIETKTGLYSEPSGAVSVGAVKKLYAEGVIKKGESVVCLLTGSGYKFSNRQMPELKIAKNVDQAIEWVK